MNDYRARELWRTDGEGDQGQLEAPLPGGMLGLFDPYSLWDVTAPGAFMVEEAEAIRICTVPLTKSLVQRSEYAVELPLRPQEP